MNFFISQKPNESEFFADTKSSIFQTKFPAIIITSEAGRQRRDVDGEEGDKDGVLHIKVFKPKNKTRGDHGNGPKLIVLNSTDSEDGKPQRGKIEKNEEGKFILETEDGTVVELKRVEKPKG